MLSMRGLYRIKAIAVLTEITHVFHNLEHGSDENNFFLMKSFLKVMRRLFFPRQRNFRMQVMIV